MSADSPHTQSASRQDALGALGAGLVGTPFEILQNGPNGLPVTGQIGVQSIVTFPLGSGGAEWVDGVKFDMTF